MELPTNLKNLYSHWKFHTTQVRQAEQGKNTADSVGGKIFKDKDMLKMSKEISWFISERINIWKKKTAGQQSPFTEDPILSTYRFCNIFREFDRQTIEFHTLLNPIRDDFPLWLLNMFYCRMVARTETIAKTIEAVGFLSFDQKENKKIYETLITLPRPRFGTPYVFPISVIQKSKTPNRETFITQYLPSIMENIAKEISEWKRESVYGGVEKILPLFKYNLRFLWTEVLIDVAYQFPEYVDLFGRFPIGPGSAPTMERICDEMRNAMNEMHDKIDGAIDEMTGSMNKAQGPSLLVTKLSSLLPIDTGLTFNGKPLVLSAENWEGVGCEFRKYTNLKSGKGRRRIFRPIG